MPLSGGAEWKDEQYPVRIVRTPCNLGGSRAWFVCPAVGCGRRVATLYGGGIFACRHCCQLAYASSREDAGGRATRRADRLRARLGWEPGILNGEVRSPKVMGGQPMRLISTPDLNCFVLSPDSGMFEHFVGLDETIEAGQPLGQLHDVRKPGNPPHVVPSPRAGLIIARRPLPMTGIGDCLFLIADE